ncbi:MAG: chromosome segregation protein SMC [Betaproteobacteria bacterium]|nr:chromosome segregation protein SMC [Betaproteobacteria bacterium]
MRLSKLKLAGFKSFVDPTVLSLPGQLVGVVGPNGCGKSNVIDAVRWVLGESKASELRGESMQDVIFNGSSNRKPVSRASVELIFDNSDGRAAGQWSQYAELSVKRVLTRNGQSEYCINNLQVRRKDITDLFLGTGLGPRAYAIIGQGMISRIIEARPDELRVFLEEAAGVTRYKERRRETEGRIADTRENLARVEDIRIELGAQTGRLEAQAAVARQYYELNGKLLRRQQLLWLLRRREEEARLERASAEIARAAAELEAQNAALSSLEARITATREEHFSSGERVQQAQGDSYAANAVVTKLEDEIHHRREMRKGLEARVAQLSAERQSWQAQAENAAKETQRWRDLSKLADARAEEAATRLEARAGTLEQAESAHREKQEKVVQERSQAAAVEQKFRVEEANQANAERALMNLGSRRQRLENERAALAVPDLGELEALEAQMSEAREHVAAAEENEAGEQQRLPGFEAARREAQAEVQKAAEAVAQIRARRQALEQLQQRVAGSGEKAAASRKWLERHALSGRTPLWKRLSAEAGWEDALEAVLRERLQAVDAGDAKLASWSADRPGTRVAVLTNLTNTEIPPCPEDSLLARVHCEAVEFAAPLAEWLSGARTRPDLARALADRDDLRAGECFVTPHGDLVTRHSLTLFAAEDPAHGLLERQREIEALSASLAAGEETRREKDAQVQACDAELAQAREKAQEARDIVKMRREEAHALQMQRMKLTQIAERYQERIAQIEAARSEILAEEEAERARSAAGKERIEEGRARFAAAQKQVEVARAVLEEAERALREERRQHSEIERELDQAQYSQRECATKLEEFARHATQAGEQLEKNAAALARCEKDIGAQDAEDLEPKLQEALEAKKQQEEALAGARNAESAAMDLLRELEEERLKIDRGLAPLREQESEQRLKEQAAKMEFEKFAQFLLEANVDAAVEADLSEELPKARPGALQGEINTLQREIEALGAVNLAALDELAATQERKAFLDAQAEDLTEALDILENAIRRIDRETRELLQNTFDAVNRHFGELFPTLFGGGEAKLIMTGDEILDAGVQVMAQPPGKRNSSIHLLSGGEKALTAIALVFSMFQLNPAPFCLLDEVDAPLDDTNTERFCAMVKRMSAQTQFFFISHNKIAMEMAQQLIGVTMQESGVSRIVEVDIEEALRMGEQVV